MKRLVILLFSFLFVETFCCTSRDDCSSVGECVKGSCSCPFGYRGTTCSDHFSAETKWQIGFYFMTSLAVFLNFISLCWALYQIKQHVKFDGWRPRMRLSLINTLLILVTIVCIGTRIFQYTYEYQVRILWGSIDPRALRGIIPKGLDTFFYYFPLIIVGEIEFLVIMIWVTSIHRNISDGVKVARRFKIIYWSFFVFSIVCLVPAVAYQVIAQDSYLSSLIVNVELSIGIIGLFVFSLSYGLKFRTLLKDLTKDGNFNGLQRVLQRTTFYVIVVHGGLVLVIILTVIYIINGTTTNPWNFVVVHTIMRVFEFIYELIVLSLTQTSATASKQSTSKSESGVGSSGVGSSKTTVAMTTSDMSVNKTQDYP